MRVAVVGSRTLHIDTLEPYIPSESTEIVSGGAKGIDQCAKEYAERKGLAYKEFLPQYARYGRGAPLKRNDALIAYADVVVVCWDGMSKGSAYVIERCRVIGKPCYVIRRKA